MDPNWGVIGPDDPEEPVRLPQRQNANLPRPTTVEGQPPAPELSSEGQPPPKGGRSRRRRRTQRRSTRRLLRLLSRRSRSVRKMRA